MPKRIVAIDSQKLDSIESCMYQYKLNFGSTSLGSEGTQPKVTPDYFERGGLLHKMFEPYYKLKVYKSRWKQNKKTHQDIVQTCIVIGRHAAAKMQLDIAEVESVIDAFSQYTDFWENDTWENILGVEKVGSKVLFDSPDLLILYEFKIDLLLNINGKTTWVDHKSSKSRRDPNSMSNQFKGYTWAVDTNNTGIINEVGFQKTVKPVDKFRRHTLQYSDSQIKEWKENAIYWIRHAIELIDKNLYPQNFTSCDKYAGCIFKPTICQADPEVRDFKLQQFFESRKWDVGLDNL